MNWHMLPRRNLKGFSDSDRIGLEGWKYLVGGEEREKR